MLNRAGHLTDIGAWYLGQNATGLKPESAASETATWAGWRVVIVAVMVATVVGWE